MIITYRAQDRHYSELRRLGENDFTEFLFILCDAMWYNEITMKNITTYSARRTNVFVWLAAVMMAASLAARIVFFANAGARDVLVVVVHIILPAAANLIIAIRLPIRGEKYFYVTVRPMVLLAIYFICNIFAMKISSVAMTIACLFFCILQSVLYFRTFSGRISSKIPVLLSYLVFLVIALIDPVFTRIYVIYFMGSMRYMLISDTLLLVGIVCIILSAKRLPDPEPGESYRPRYKDRMDGRLVRGLPPLTRVAPYIMVERNASSNMISDSVEISNLERYIHQKRREGYKHFGITHVFIAAYVRACAEIPELNRFIAGQKIYQRYNVQVNMAVKKDMTIDSCETIIKVDFNRTDTAAEVYEKYDAVLQSVKESEEYDSSFDVLAKILGYIPGVLMKFAIWFIKLLDYFGLVPVELLDLSPFHGSMFITSMGSLGIPPIYHHLYNLGNVTQFCAFGAKRSVRSFAPDGTETVRKYIDYNWVVDERTLDGFGYAAVLKRMRSFLAHPEQLDDIPEIKEDID